MVPRTPFLEALPPALRDRFGALPGLGEALGRVLAEARAAGPWAPPEDAILEQLGRTLRPDEGNPDGALATIQAADLALACACARGDSRAIAVFEERCVPAAAAAIRELRLSPQVADEAVQQVRVDLLAPRTGGERPRISEFGGRGPLAAWVRVSAVRSALRAKARLAREVPAEDDLLLGVASPSEDPGLAMLRERFRSAFRDSFRGALGSLEPPDRLLLRQHHVDGLTLDEVAALHGVHRATIARRLASGRDKLLKRTRQALAGKYRISPADCASLLRIARSQLDLSLPLELTRDTLPEK